MKIKSVHILSFYLIVIPFTSAQIDQNLENRYRLASSYENSGQYDKAEVIYRELTNLQPWNFQYFEALNKLLIKQKKYAESVTLLESKIKETPADINLYGMLGSAYYMMDNLPEAFDAWERSIRSNPDSFIVYRVIANYAIENRAFDKAIEILKRGKAFTNDPAIFSLDLSSIYVVNMKFIDAALEFCNLLEKYPDQIGVVKSRISSYISRPGAAEQTIETVKNFANDLNQAVFYDLLSFVYISNGKYEEAFLATIEFEKLSKSNGVYVFIFAQDAYRNRQYETASKAYEYIIKNFPQSPQVPIVKIGYARTLEAGLDQKYIKENESWKTFVKPVPLNNKDYLSIINAYNKLAYEFPADAIFTEAVFRMANVYMNRIFDYQKADSLFKIINQKPSLSNYSSLALIARGKIAILQNNLNEARSLFEKVISLPFNEPNNLAETNYYLARIVFWQGNFSKSLQLFREVIKNLSADITNDALELSSIISTTKRDSINLLQYARADLLSIQNKFKEAAIEFKTLADNPNLFILNEFAKIKFAEMLIAENDLPFAIKILEEAVESQNSAIFAEKSTFLLAQCFQYGIQDPMKATIFYQKILEKFTNSLYFNRAREQLNILQTKDGKK